MIDYMYKLLKAAHASNIPPKFLYHRPSNQPSTLFLNKLGLWCLCVPHLAQASFFQKIKLFKIFLWYFSSREGSMSSKKVFLSVSIATISTFLQRCTLWRHNYETSQPKIGQCDVGVFSLAFHLLFKSCSTYCVPALNKLGLWCLCVPHLAQASFFQKNQTFQNISLIFFI